jgi:MOSC domain-containing protein YiiM
MATVIHLFRAPKRRQPMAGSASGNAGRRGMLSRVLRGGFLRRGDETVIWERMEAGRS